MHSNRCRTCQHELLKYLQGKYCYRRADSIRRNTSSVEWVSSIPSCRVTIYDMVILSTRSQDDIIDCEMT